MGCLQFSLGSKYNFSITSNIYIFSCIAPPCLSLVSFLLSAYQGNVLYKFIARPCMSHISMRGPSLRCHNNLTGFKVGELVPIFQAFQDF